LFTPFPRITYQEAIDLYGTDKPDLRFGLKLTSLSDLVSDSGFGIFEKIVGQGGVVRGFAATGCANYSRNELQALIEFAKARGAQGLVTVALDGDVSDIKNLKSDQIRSILTKHVSLTKIKEIATKMDARIGDLLLIVAGRPKMVNTVLSQLRNEIGKRLGLAASNQLAFTFVVDFPIVDWNNDENRWDPGHHPFTMPHENDLQYLESDPGRVKAHCYDLVVNGIELASGSIRIHQRELQERIFAILGYSKEQVNERFGHLLQAFEFGAPPHGGIAPGIDRLAMILAGEENIREVIAFPKTQSSIDPLFESPSSVTSIQLNELHIKVTDD